MALFYIPDLTDGILPEAEAKHALQVLRMRKGDEIQLTDGKGRKARAIILQEKSANCSIQLIESEIVEPFRQQEIHLAVAPTKNSERMEWMVEKATELGCNGFHFFKSERTSRNHLNLERLQRICLSAIKQSGQFYLPETNWYSGLKEIPFEAFDRVVTADLSTSNRNLLPLPFRKMLLLIGPEGDFSEAELSWLSAKQTESVRLLPQVLRTETAALYALSMSLISLPG